jgi:DNA helicase-2/ATP-dependent DNA helicase PcrA
MSEVPPFEPPEVTDEDIRYVSRLLKLPDNAFHAVDGTDRRQDVLKAMGQIDVAACPGSGKTTLLVAKLAILAEKWQYRTRGICVLSHTNIARIQIETLLGNTTAGRRLLSYPHYIGTIHGFVDEFLAVPWLRSQGYPIKMIDTQICEKRRWRKLCYKSRFCLEKQHLDESNIRIVNARFKLAKKNGPFPFADHTDTCIDLTRACQETAKEGYHCFDDMFIWAHDLLENVLGVVNVIRDRFPLLFIDEAQDNSEDQSAILHRIFLDGAGAVVRQRFGDSNQAIFDFMEAKEATTDPFPDSEFQKDIPNSHRFGQKIAELADPLGLIPYCLQGQGPKKPLVSGAKEAPHTIFLFNDNTVGKVMDAYAELLIETFSEQELREGTFTAVGQVHKPPDEGMNEKFPHHVGHYWPEYDLELARRDPKPQTFVQYVFAGLGKAKIIGEVFPAVEKIAEAILRLAAMAEGKTTFRERLHKHRHVLGLLCDNAEVRKHYSNLIAKFAVEKEVLTKETWDSHWRGLVRKIAETIASASLSSAEVSDFLAWKDGPDASAQPSSARPSRDNIYRFVKNGKEVCVRVGSVHSVKGETHTAMLVLETFWYKHNLASIKDWLCGDQKGCAGKGPQIESRLKIHYVAMTRPSHLLCLAMKRTSFENGKRDLDQDLLNRMKRHGWQIKLI